MDEDSGCNLPPGLHRISSVRPASSGDSGYYLLFIVYTNDPREPLHVHSDGVFLGTIPSSELSCQPVIQMLSSGPVYALWKDGILP